MKYSPVIDEIISTTSPAPLDSGVQKGGLGKVDFASLFGNSEVKNLSFAKCVHAGLALRLNDLQKCHDIVNDIPSAEGSYWHALMHRREPDISNSNYWFRRVGPHPVFPRLLAKVKGIAGGENNRYINSLTGSGQWNPNLFNKLCDTSRGSGSDQEALCIQIQELEWQILFDYCYINSLGKTN